MLAVLKIKNLALVEDVTWELGNGLIGVTGQTGAGKSMIVGALKLILGERANRDLIRQGEKMCTVEAVFRLSTNLKAVNALLAECGVDECDGDALIIKRSFGSGNSQFVNCSPCTLSLLKRLGSLLIDLHGPHEHQSLLSRERQLAMLDAYAHSSSELGNYNDAFRDWQTSVAELEQFKSEGIASDQEIELLRYQLEEITNAALIEEEMNELERRYTQAKNAARLISAASRSLEILRQAGASLTEARKHLNELEALDPDSQSFLTGFDSSRLEIDAVVESLQEYTEDLEIDPAELKEMESRIDQVENLKRKYGQTIKEVLSFQNSAKARLMKVDHRGDQLERLEKKIEISFQNVRKAGAKLSQKRKAACRNLEVDIKTQLEGLGFAQSVFEVALEPVDTPQSHGLESAEFLFCPNPGEATKPLRIVASSGEMSRVMLAVKSALAEQDETPLMVFDEIDANVGGEIAGAVGAKMAALGARHQVVSITHMPQVAALANHHYLVTKSVVKNRRYQRSKR